VRDFARNFPVLNAVLAVSVFLLIAGLIVFAKPVERVLDRLNLKLLQALGIASRDDRGDRDSSDDSDSSDDPDSRDGHAR
jgi:hypothetical protein